MPLPVPFFLQEEILPISPSAGVLPYLVGQYDIVEFTSKLKRQAKW